MFGQIGQKRANIEKPKPVIGAISTVQSTLFKR